MTDFFQNKGVKRAAIHHFQEQIQLSRTSVLTLENKSFSSYVTKISSNQTLFIQLRQFSTETVATDNLFTFSFTILDQKIIYLHLMTLEMITDTVRK